MAKKNKFNISDGIAKIIFWVIMILVCLGIIAAGIFFIKACFDDIGKTVTGDTETTTATANEFPTFTGEDPGVALGAVDIRIYADRLVATPTVEYQLGNEIVRFGNNVFMEKIDLSGTIPRDLPIISINEVYNDIVNTPTYAFTDSNGLRRMMTTADKYSFHGSDDYFVIMDGQLNERYLIETENGIFTCVCVDSGSFHFVCDDMINVPDIVTGTIINAYHITEIN